MMRRMLITVSYTHLDVYKRQVYPPCLPVDQLGQCIHIGRFQLGQFPESKDIIHNLVTLGRQFQQYIFPGLVLPGLCFFSRRIKFEFVK